MKRTGAETNQVNPYLRKLVLEAVENQLRDNDPPETAVTLERLMAKGCSREDAKVKIAAVLVEHMYTTLHDQIPFDGAAYIRDLRKIR